MKKKLLALPLLLLLVGCNNQKLTHQETVIKYYNAFGSGNFNEIRSLTNDTIIITSGDYVTPYTHESFHEFFKWDSIFEPTYEIVKLEEKNNHVFATVAQNNLRNEFLKNNPLVFQVKISFDSGKMSKVEELEYKDVNWNIWNQKKDSLVDWIKDNYSELDGFANNMTMQGATNYLKAIELYKTGIDKTVYEMWNSFIESNPEFNKEEMPEAWFFHNNEKDANRLAELTLNGKKKASSGLYFWYEEAGANLPTTGTKHIITDFNGKAKAIIEIIEVDTIPFNKVSKEYAEMDMGTSDNPLKKWRKAHWDFFSQAMEESGQKPTEDILVVCERFETIWPIKKNL
nr:MULTISPECIES: ASCH domain-containing protein [unclassified Allomuricauda]|tara:strand:- start:1054 stop:2082 length:1029 start_codon:yes stop_codon:yes gene_type:complete